ncbi:TPA: hypothetical protein ACOQ39_005598 [Bacillus cereus]|uniref:hypothetical protein n=1 Tax=Bacillus cereus TaxID=1396 RepID=UPI001926712D|nr:hypothetical protein [Bacillus cereus]MBL3880855.1 hypothetical protein [Bacillus cereus]HDR7981245.1 hypothetical protein [Bacillus cereus]HDR8073788.1 hypothetical protein [Bacillus cereus]HDR8216142.1 hypothetical protein [Bacillus cereus]HDR8231046.1 hypothetical protein [Bacillus cereus]
MKTVKVIIFIIGICLINFVGGIPTDARNLFITHTIFLAPYLVEFYELLSLKSHMKWFIRLIWVAGILALVVNILGITGIIIVKEMKVIFNPEYYIPLELNLGLRKYLLIQGCVYSVVFVGTITFHFIAVLNQKLLEVEKSKGKGKEMVDHASAR